MKLDLIEERVRFNFPNANKLFKFDEKDTMSPTYHGAPMKGVDVVAEFSGFQLWIEIKEYTPEEIIQMRKECGQRKTNEPNHKSWLLGYFKYKFRDTFLYRFCEDKVGLPVVYVCLTNFDSALNLYFKKELRRHLPTGKANGKRWKKELIAKDNVHVVDFAAWERNLEPRFGECKKY